MPFVDPVVFEAAFSLSGKDKIHGRVQKAALKDGGPGLGARTRSSTGPRRPSGCRCGPGSPTTWARSSTTCWCPASWWPPASCSREPLSRLIADQRAGRRDNSKQIWQLLSLELWYRNARERGGGSGMKQVAQNYRSGELAVLDVPVPACRPGGVLVRSLYSLISTGTEMMKVSEARLSLLGKAQGAPGPGEEARRLGGPAGSAGDVQEGDEPARQLHAAGLLAVRRGGRGRRRRRGVPGRRPGRRGRQRVRAARRGQLGADQPGRQGARRCPPRARRVRDRGGDRHAGRAPGRAAARRAGLRHRARAGRPAGGPAAGRRRRAGGRRRHRRGTLPDGREGRRAGVRRARRRTAPPTSSRCCRAATGGLGCRPRAARGRGRLQRAGRAGGPAGPGPGHGRRHRQDPARPAVERLLREGARRPVLAVLRAGPVRRPLRARGHRLPRGLRAVDRAPQPRLLPRPDRRRRDRRGVPGLRRPSDRGRGGDRTRSCAPERWKASGSCSSTRVRRTPTNRPTRRRRTRTGELSLRRRRAGSGPARPVARTYGSASSAPATTPRRCCCRTSRATRRPTWPRSRPPGRCPRSTRSASSGSRR